MRFCSFEGLEVEYFQAENIQSAIIQAMCFEINLGILVLSEELDIIADMMSCPDRCHQCGIGMGKPAAL